jgi:signal transduction histidine kinase
LEQSAFIQIPPPSHDPYYIHIDQKQRLWCSVHFDRVVVYDVSGIPRLLRTLRFPKDISVSSVRAIGSDTLGNTWVGGFGDGLDMVSPEWKNRHFTTHDGLPDNSVRAIANDERGRLWIGTRYGGIAVYDGAHFTSISTAQGLLSNTVWSLSYDGHHKMWLATPLGPVWVSTLNLNETGWYSSIVGYDTYCCQADEEQRLWARTVDEIILCEYGHRTPNAVPPPIYISSIFVNNTAVSLQPVFEVPYDKNTWGIRYIGLSFRDEVAVRFRYRLLGSSTEWSAPTSERSVTFAALRPSSYRFEVEAINCDGVPSVQPAAFEFTIIPPFWLQWWFIGGMASVVGGVTILALRSRFTRLKEEQRRQREFSKLFIDLQEAERKRIAAELHDGLGQNLLIIKNLAELGTRHTGIDQDARRHLTDISAIAGRSVAEVREIAYNLRPHLLDKLGLTKSLRGMIRQVAESTPISFSSSIDELENLFSPEEEISIYRIVQEAVNNIVKHSKATTAFVSITVLADQVMICVTDNGNGFSTDSPPPSQSGKSGLMAMAERVHLLRGTWSLTSEPGRGTTMRAAIPFKQRTT